MKKVLLFLVIMFIFLIHVNAYDKYNAGDIVKYNDKEYYILYDSDNNDDYLTLMYKDYLTQDEINRYGDNNFNDSVYLIKFENSSGLLVGRDEYNKTFMKDILDKWIINFSDDLVEINGYKTRLLNEEDTINLGYNYGCGGYLTSYSYTAKPGHTLANYNVVRNENQMGGYTYYVYLTIDGVNYEGPYSPDSNGNFIVFNNSVINGSSINMLDYLDVVISKHCDPMAPSSRYISSPNPYNWLSGSYWTMIYKNEKIYVSRGDKFEDVNTDSLYSVRPVINLKKSVLGNQSNYNIGDEVIYRNSRYHVIKNTDSSENYVTLFRDNSFSKLEVYGILYGGGFGLTQYYYDSEHCSLSGDFTDCKTSYSTSFAKKILNNWTAANFHSNDLIKLNDSDTVRLLTTDELIDNFFYEPRTSGYDKIYTSTPDTPEWFIPSVPFWINTYDETEKEYAYVLYPKSAKFDEVYNYQALRPIVTVSKCAFNDSGCDKRYCEEGTTPVYGKRLKYVGNYEVGQIITINDERYMVIEDSSISNESVKLIKLRLLTQEQINKYNKSEYQSTQGEMPFNVKCYNDNDYYYDNSDECVDYDSSTIKEITDNWGKDIFGDSYIKSNLITKKQIEELLKYKEETRFTQYGDIITSYLPTEETPTEITDNEYYAYAKDDEWLMLYTYGTNGVYFYDIIFSGPAHIRPVIEIDKCAIDGGCEYEDVITGCLTPDGEIIPVIPPEDNPTDNPKKVTVENTLSMISKIAIIISIICIITGLFILLYDFDKMRKEKNI